MVTVAQGRTLIDFGSRRGHGPYSGFSPHVLPTSRDLTVRATSRRARLLGIPASGTMAHSWVQAFDTEDGGFRRLRPGVSRIDHASG